MNGIDSKANKLDEHIPDYVLGRTDGRLNQLIEEKMQCDKRFEKQVHIEQALVAGMSANAGKSTQYASDFDALRQRISAEGEAQENNSFQAMRYLPAIAASFLVAAVALPLLMQNADEKGNEFEVLSAPLSAPVQEQKMLRIIYSESISDRRRDEIALLYKLEEIETVGALNSVIYKLPNQATTDQLLAALRQEESVEFASLTKAIK